MCEKLKGEGKNYQSRGYANMWLACVYVCETSMVEQNERAHNTVAWILQYIYINVEEQ